MIKNDKLIVVDLEATCWEKKPPPENQKSYIIEIGICLWDTKTGEISDKKSFVVKPKRSTISDYCTQLTGFKQEDVDKGISFEKACEKISAGYRTRKRVWASWGDYDRSMMIQQCRDFRVKYPFSNHHLNIKAAFSIFRRMGKGGLEKALAKVGLEFEGQQHRGVDDAYNITRLLKFLKPFDQQLQN